MRKYIAILLAAVLALTLPVMAAAAPAKGDLNGNGVVEVTDVQALYAYLAHGTIPKGVNASVFRPAADIDQDGTITILDYQALYAYLCYLKERSEWSDPV